MKKWLSTNSWCALAFTIAGLAMVTTDLALVSFTSVHWNLLRHLLRFGAPSASLIASVLWGYRAYHKTGEVYVGGLPLNWFNCVGCVAQAVVTLSFYLRRLA